MKDEWDEFPELGKALPKARAPKGEQVREELQGTWGRDITRAAAQGATFGLADEGEAALRAAFGGGGYDDTLANIRAENMAFRQQHPALSYGVDFGAGLLTNLPGGKWLGETLENAPRAVRFAVPGAAGGALAGFGYSEADSMSGQLTDAAQGAGMGAGLGLLLDPLARGAGWTLGKMATIPSKLARWGAEMPQDTALKTVGRVARQSGFDAGDLQRSLDELGPEAVPADANETMRMLGEASANRTIAGRQAAADVLEPRQLGQQRRIMDALRITSRKDMSVLDFLDEATDLRKAASEPAYTAMREAGLDFDAVPGARDKLKELFNRPTMKSALRVARRKAADQGVMPPETAAAGAAPPTGMAAVDARLADEGYQQALRRMSGDLTIGGGVAYVRDRNGNIINRTGSTNPSWFQDLDAPVREVQAAVAKTLRGEPLTKGQTRIIRQMLDIEEDAANMHGGAASFDDWATLDGTAPGRPAGGELFGAKQADDLTITDLDYAKRALDDKIGAALRQGKKDDARIYLELKEELLDLADTMNPAYKAARDTYSEFSSVMTAAKLGREALTEDSEILARQIKKMSDPEKEAFRLGAADAIRKRLNEGGETHNNAAKLLRSPEFKQRVATAFPDENAFNAFKRQLQAEASFVTTRQNSLYGPQTARRLTIAKAVGNEAAADAMDTAGTAVQGAAGVASGSPATILSALLSGGSKVLKRDMSEAAWRELARLMYAQPAEVKARLIRAISSQTSRTAREEWLIKALQGSMRLNIGREAGRSVATQQPYLLVPEPDAVSP